MTTIDRLRKLRAKATPGRWDRDGDAFGCGGVQLGLAGEADSELIVAAVNALPRLLALAEKGDQSGCAERELRKLRKKYRILNNAAADLVAEAVGPYDPPQRGSNLERLYRLVTRP